MLHKIDKILSTIIFFPARLLLMAAEFSYNLLLSFFSKIVIPFLKNKGIPFIRNYILPFILNKMVPFIVKRFGPFFVAYFLPIYKKVEPLLTLFWDHHSFYLTFILLPCFILEFIGVVFFGHSARAYFEWELASFLFYLFGKYKGQ